MMRILYILLILVLIAVGAVFTAQNAQVVSLDLFIARSEVPLAVSLVASLVVGAIIGVLFNLGQVLSLRRRLSQLRREAGLAQQEIANLRAIPFKDAH